MNSTKKAPIGKEFNLEDGRVLRNVKDLMKALETMSDNIFKHHVNAHRNDFSNWLDHVFGYKELARNLRRVKTRESTLKKIKSAIVEELKNKVKKSTVKKPAVSTKKKTAKKPSTQKKSTKKATSVKKKKSTKKTVKKAPAKKKSTKKAAKKTSKK